MVQPKTDPGTLSSCRPSEIEAPSPPFCMRKVHISIELVRSFVIFSYAAQRDTWWYYSFFLVDHFRVNHATAQFNWVLVKKETPSKRLILVALTETGGWNLFFSANTIRRIYAGSPHVPHHGAHQHHATHQSYHLRRSAKAYHQIGNFSRPSIRTEFPKMPCVLMCKEIQQNLWKLFEGL